MPITRRRTARTEEPEEKRDRPTRRHRSGDDKGAGVADEPTRRADDDDDRPRRGRRSSGSKSEGAGGGRRSTRGFASYEQKKVVNSDYADEFKPGPNEPTLIRFLDSEPFDTYNQHWIEEGAAAGQTRHSFVCRDDDYFDDDDGCPLCEVGDGPSTYSLFNIVDFGPADKPSRSPVVKVWKASPAVTDKLLRASNEKKTSPINREDLYFEVTKAKKGKRIEWELAPVKARDLTEDYGVEPLDAKEIESFEDEMFQDRSAITKVDTYDDLLELADSLD